MALGAAPGGVMRAVLIRAGALMLVGVLAGTPISVWASRFVAALLHDLAPGDPGTLAIAAVVLCTVGLLAGWVPARRAARIDPATVLKSLSACPSGRTQGNHQVAGSRVAVTN